MAPVSFHCYLCVALFAGVLAVFLEPNGAEGLLAPEGLEFTSDMLKAYYINLDQSTGRRETMEAFVDRTGLPAKRFPAVDTVRIEAGEFNAKYMDRQGIKNVTLTRLIKTGSLNQTLACFISHAEVLELAKREAVSDNQLVMVLEDDVEIPQDWRMKVQTAVRAAPQDWQMLKLSGWGWKRHADLMATPRHSGKDPYDGSFYLLKAPYWGSVFTPLPYYGGSGAYLVRSKDIPVVLNHLKTQPISDYDEMLLSVDGSFRAYEIFPHVFGLRPEHELSVIRPNGMGAVGRWFASKVEHMFF